MPAKLTTIMSNIKSVVFEIIHPKETKVRVQASPSDTPESTIMASNTLNQKLATENQKHETQVKNDDELYLTLSNYHLSKDQIPDSFFQDYEKENGWHETVIKEHDFSENEIIEEKKQFHTVSESKKDEKDIANQNEPVKKE